jgi:hypothetical protein
MSELQVSAKASGTVVGKGPEQRTGAEHDHKVARIRRVEQSISRLERLDLIYLLGGARGSRAITPPAGAGVEWTDCSGFVLFELAVAGIQTRFPTGWTGTLAQEGSEGLSEYLTVFLKEPEQTEGHTILRLRHHPGWPHREGAAEWRWAECGGRDNPHAGDGPTWFKPTDERIAEFPIRRHFRALS